MFRAAALLTSGTLPLAAARLVPGPGATALGGSVLVLLLAAGLVHRALAWRRRIGAAARLIDRVRWALEAAGLLLFAAAGARKLLGDPVPASLLFWALILLRLSIADLLDPSRLVRRTGLADSAVKDLGKAVRPGKARRARSVRGRGGRAARGLLKLAAALAWLALPLLAALAPEEVRQGAWPPGALVLVFYPAAALALTSVVLVVDALAALPGRPREAARGLAVGIATCLFLIEAYRDPAFTAYRNGVPGLYLVETVFAFLLGAASRGR